MSSTFIAGRDLILRVTSQRILTKHDPSKAKEPVNESTDVTPNAICEMEYRHVTTRALRKTLLG